MTKQEILGRALELFTEKGYEGTGMDDIAKAVGIRKASLYYHFDGKESIFSAVFNGILAEYAAYVAGLTTVGEGTSVLTNLKELFLSYIRYCKTNPKMYFWDRYFYYPPEFLKDYIAEKTLETETAFMEGIGRMVEAGIVRGQIKPQPARSLTLTYYYLLIGLSMSVRLYEEERLMADAEAAVEGLLQAVKMQSI